MAFLTDEETLRLECATRPSRREIRTRMEPMLDTNALDLLPSGTKTTPLPQFRTTDIQTSSLRVLLIEDSPADTCLIQEMLREGSFAEIDFRCATRVSEGLAQLAEWEADIILLDLSLPDSDGIDTFRTLHAHAPSVPTIVLSGLDDEQLGLNAVQEGAQDYLVKGHGGSHLLSRAVRYAIERKRTEQRLAYLAQYDPLTGMANRTLFLDRLTQALALAKRNEWLVAIMFLDLDRFKIINDTLGHAIGDLLLKGVAERLRQCLRESDTVARMGGDEFTFILEGITVMRDVETVAKKVLNAMAAPFTFDGQEVFVTTSIGISTYPGCGDDAGVLTKHADAAMYRAKDHGRNTYQFYTPEMNVYTTIRLSLENNLRHALERREFFLHYQPQIDISTGRVMGMEALIRWKRPTMEIIPPNQFIPLMEETGLIIPVGKWVLKTACAQIRAWLNVGLPPIPVAVNISPRQLWHGDLPSTIFNILQDSGLPPSLLELEITEGILMEHTQVNSSTINDLKAMGIRIAIDDFGTGYSSLSYLTRFPIDTLKIDQSFVREITTNHDDAAIATAIIDLAHRLRRTVIAEGVETLEQLDFLREHRCDQVQGYLVSRPLSTEGIEGWLTDGMQEPIGTPTSDITRDPFVLWQVPAA